MKKAVIYVRAASGVVANPKDSITGQVQSCMAVAKNLKLQLADAGVYEDIGKSGMSMNRPALTAMLQRVEKDKSIGAVIVDDMHRLSRNSIDTVTMLMRLFYKGKEVIIAKK